MNSDYKTNILKSKRGFSFALLFCFLLQGALADPPKITHFPLNHFGENPNGVSHFENKTALASNHGLTLFNGEDIEYVSNSNGLIKNSVAAVDWSPKGELWVLQKSEGEATSNILSVRNLNNEWRHYGLEKHFESFPLVYSLEATERAVWVGSKVNLLRLDLKTGHWDTTTIRKGSYPFDGEGVYSLMQTSPESLWVGTQDSLYLFSTPRTPIVKEILNVDDYGDITVEYDTTWSKQINSWGDFINGATGVTQIKKDHNDSIIASTSSELYRFQPTTNSWKQILSLPNGVIKNIEVHADSTMLFLNNGMAYSLKDGDVYNEINLLDEGLYSFFSKGKKDFAICYSGVFSKSQGSTKWVREDLGNRHLDIEPYLIGGIQNYGAMSQFHGYEISLTHDDTQIINKLSNQEVGASFQFKGGEQFAFINGKLFDFDKGQAVSSVSHSSPWRSGLVIDNEAWFSYASTLVYLSQTQSELKKEIITNFGACPEVLKIYSLPKLSKTPIFLCENGMFVRNTSGEFEPINFYENGEKIIWQGLKEIAFKGDTLFFLKPNELSASKVLSIDKEVKLEALNENEVGIPLGAENLNHLCVDSENRLWVGTRFDGLYMYSGGSWETVRSTEGLGEETILGMSCTNQSGVWVWGSFSLSVIHSKVEPLSAYKGVEPQFYSSTSLSLKENTELKVYSIKGSFLGSINLAPGKYSVKEMSKGYQGPSLLVWKDAEMVFYTISIE